MTRRTYAELLSYQTFEERFDYLSLVGTVGVETFGFNRYLNQQMYTSKEWRDIKSYVITRDLGCDLAIPDRLIVGEPIIVHHMNPVTLDQLESSDPEVFDPEFLIATSSATHRAIHYGYTVSTDPHNRDWRPRTPSDTSPWRK